jgi:NitT/TauT family transport system substrate-binding protein
MLKSTRWLGAAAAVALYATGAHSAERISFLMSWKAQAEQGGYYQALAKGYYAECGLDVVIRQGGPGIDTSQLLAGGAVEFALAPHIDAVLHMNIAGFPARAVMAAFQRSPQILMTHAGNGIERFEDMKDKPIMISAGSRATYWPILRQKYGWSDTQIRSYSGQMAAWFADKMAIQQGLITNEPFLVKRETGEFPKSFLLADYGYSTYGSVVTTSQEFIDKNPRATQCLVDASVRGWEDYLRDPALGFSVLKKEDPQNSDDLMGYTYKVMKESQLVVNEDTDKYGFGIMTDARWKAHHDMLAEAGLLKGDVDYRTAMTLRFLKKATN